MAMLDLLPLATVAEMIGVPAHTLSNMFFHKQLDGSKAPLVGRTRCIPREYIPEIKAKIRERIRKRKQALEQRLKQLA
jgi:hypothetical protein